MTMLGESVHRRAVCTTHQGSSESQTERESTSPEQWVLTHDNPTTRYRAPVAEGQVDTALTELSGRR